MKISGMNSPPYLSAPPGEPVPEWEKDNMVERTCIVCSSDQHSTVCYRPDGLVVVQCSDCAALYVPVIPDSKQLQKYYNSYSKTKPYQQPLPASSGRLSASPLRRLLYGFLISSKAGRILRQLLSKARPILLSETCELLVRTGGLEGRSVLEIGPGKTGGILPEVTLFGGRGIAMEIDETAVQSVAELGVSVYQDISEIPHMVNIIYMCMVLEHVQDPGSMLKKLSDLTEPDGRILIRVPNAGQAYQIGTNWIGFRVDLEHLNYFDQRSLNTLLFNAGYQTECVWLTSQPMLPEYLPMADRHQFMAYARKKLRHPVYCCSDPFSTAGEFMLTVLARKNVFNQQARDV